MNVTNKMLGNILGEISIQSLHKAVTKRLQVIAENTKPAE
jgi:hypothetical protein